MEYTPHTWVKNEAVTTERLNALENGISGNQILIVRVNGERVDKTWKEIYDSLEAHMPVFLIFDSIIRVIISAYLSEDMSRKYCVDYSHAGNSYETLRASSENAYPEASIK